PMPATAVYAPLSLHDALPISAPGGPVEVKHRDAVPPHRARAEARVVQPVDGRGRADEVVLAQTDERSERAAEGHDLPVDDLGVPRVPGPLPLDDLVGDGGRHRAARPVALDLVLRAVRVEAELLERGVERGGGVVRRGV